MRPCWQEMSSEGPSCLEEEKQHSVGRRFKLKVNSLKYRDGRWHTHPRDVFVFRVTTVWVWWRSWTWGEKKRRRNDERNPSRLTVGLFQGGQKQMKRKLSITRTKMGKKIRTKVISTPWGQVILDDFKAPENLVPNDSICNSWLNNQQSKDTIWKKLLMYYLLRV